MLTAKAPGPALLVFTTNSHAVPRANETGEREDGGDNEDNHGRFSKTRKDTVQFRGTVRYLWCLPPVLVRRQTPSLGLQPGPSLQLGS